MCTSMLHFLMHSTKNWVDGSSRLDIIGDLCRCKSSCSRFQAISLIHVISIRKSDGLIQKDCSVVRLLSAAVLTQREIASYVALSIASYSKRNPTIHHQLCCPIDSFRTKKVDFREKRLFSRSMNKMSLWMNLSNILLQRIVASYAYYVSKVIVPTDAF